MSKLSKFAFKFLDLMVIFVMLFGSPMSALAQDPAPVLNVDKPDYAPGEVAHITGEGFSPGNYTLSVNTPEGTADWGTVTVDEGGGFTTDSPALTEGTYEVNAVAASADPVIASVSFTVTAPPPPTDTPTEPPTATEPPTEPPTATEPPTDTPTSEPTQEPTVVPTDTPTAEPTVAPTDTPTSEPTPLPPPYIQSDKADYAPGELVTLTGGNWQGDTNVIITVVDAVPTVYRDTDQVTVQADGTIIDSFNLPTSFVDVYYVTAKGAQTGRIATTTFTDLSIGTYDQCANDQGTGYTSGDQGCRWINGNLQSNAAYYAEGDATVQRLWLKDFPPGSHSVTFDYGTTKGGKHAYDFLTAWNWSENWITDADRCQDIPGCTTAAETTTNIPNDPNVPDTFEPNTPGARQFVMRGGTLTGASFATPIPFTGSYAGDSDTRITITFTVPNSGSMCHTDRGVTTCDIALWFGAHVSAQANWGLGMGAGSISGSPYHVMMALVDSSGGVGSRDNQMQAAVVTQIPNGTIVISKDAIPNDAQDFSFNLNNNSTISQNFSLDDDSDPTLPNSQTFSVPPGTWYATETMPLPSGWSLTNLVCVDPTSNTTVNLSTGVATINLASNETVTCTYTNAKAGQIIVKKETTPDGSTQQFEFDPSWSATNFFLKDGEQKNSGILAAGTYSVAEVNLAAGWSLTSATCDDGSKVESISLQEGETITCTFNNALSAKDLTVTKTATPSFTRTYKWGISKAVDQTQINIAEGGMATFNYTVNLTHDTGTDSAWVVTGTITISNPNAYAVSGVSVSDAIDPNATCSVTGGSSTIAANSSANFDYTCAYSAAPAASSQTNTATATWTAFGSPNTSASGTASVDWSQVSPALVDETVTVKDNGTTLGTVSYSDPSPKAFTYSKTFTGDQAGKCTDHNNTATFITNDSATTGSASQSVKVCVGKDLTVTKTATASLSRTYKWLIDKSVDDTRIEIAEGGTATFNYSLKVTPDGYVDSGYVLGGTITINNPNDWEDITVDVADALDKGGACTITETAPYLVPKGGSLTLHYTCTTDGTTTKNTATVAWNKDTYFTPSGSASSSAEVSFTVGGEANKTITVIDDKADPANPVELGTWKWADGEHTFTYSLEKQGMAGKCTDYNNTATIKETKQSDSQKVTVCVGKDLTVTKTAVGTFNRTYLWKISKDVNQTLVQIADGGDYIFKYTVVAEQTGISDAGWVVSGVITITNPNDWEDIMLTSITDAVDNGGTCTVDPTLPLVEKGKSVDVNYSCSFGKTPTSYTGKNTATVTWNKALAFTPTGEATASKDFTLSQFGTTNKTVHVTDSYGGDLGTVTATDTAPFAKGTFSYDRKESGVAGTCTKYDNTATITETGQSADKSVTVCVGKDLTITKTAAGTFNREYLWKITKDVDKTQIKMAEGSTATFKYTVIAEQTGFTDSGWTLSGVITITNPNDWEDITLTGLTDAVDNGGTCTVDAGPYTVLAGKSLEVGYSCSYGSASALSGKNTATATWDNDLAFTPTGTVSAEKAFALSQVGKTNQTVHITDTFGDALGTLTATDTAPFTKQTFTYSKDFVGVGGKCTTYNNQAEITETGQSDSESVEVCVAKDLTLTKTAVGTFDRSYLWKISKDVDQTLVKIAEGGDYTFHYTVGVEQTGISDKGWTLSGVITITNPNEWEDIMLTSITDVVDNGGTCSVNPTLPLVEKGKSVDVHYGCTFPVGGPSSYSGKNTATVTWNQELAFTPTATAFGSADFALSQLGTTNKTIHVTDTYGGNFSTVTATDVAPFAKGTFTYDRTESGVAGTCTKYDNTATISETGQSADKSVTLCVGKDLTVTKSGAGTYNRTYKWLIDKSVDDTRIEIADGGTAKFNYTVKVTPDGYTDSRWTLGGEITVNNPNNWEDIAADVTDEFPGGVCTVTGGEDVVIPAGQSVTLDYSCTFDQQPAYTGKNTATAIWDAAKYFTPTSSASGEAAVTLTLNGETDRTITVVDDQTDPANSVTLGTSDYYTGPFEFTYTLEKQGVAGTCTKYDNTATIQETTQSADESVTLCVAKDLTVTKTATGSFNREYLWDIQKVVDKPLVNMPFGQTATFNYTVKAFQTGIKDTGWTLSGVITITNPNDWEDIMLTGLTDLVDNGGTCTVNPTLPIVPKGGKVDVSYSCTFPDEGPKSYTGTNTATVNWDKALAFTPTGTASGAAPFTLAQNTASDLNKTVTVTDTLGGDLGTVTAEDKEPWASKEFTYSKGFTGEAGTCKEYDNTATITETKDTASQKVKVCTGVELTVTKAAAGTFDRTYFWSIDKSVDDTHIEIAAGNKATFNYLVKLTTNGFTDSGWTLSGKITVTNPNVWEDITTTVTDVYDGGGTCNVTGGVDVIIPAGQSVVLDYSCTFQDQPKYTGVNTAKATWDAATYFTPKGTASGTADVTINLKGETNRTVDVYDDKTTETPVKLGTSDYYDGPFEYKYALEKTGVAGTCTDYINTSTIDQTKQSDKQTVTVCVAKDLTVTKTATGSFDRKYLWTIDKSVDKKYATTINTPVTFNYTVLVSQTGVEDSGWTLSGVITITNPNDWEDIMLTGITDVVGNGGTCTAAPTLPLVEKGKSVDVAYSCTFPAEGPTSYSGKNTATVTWNQALAFTPTNTASGSADFTLSKKGSKNPTVHVTDTYGGDLGTVTATDAEPWASKSFTYSRTINPPANKICEKYDNTATIVETGQKDNETVQVCLPSLVTSSSLCTFDYDSAMTGNQFRLLFTPTVGAPSYKLNASNPGQFYYNVFYSNETDHAVTPVVEITLPYPFVTQGATPIHAYSGVTVTQSNGQYCLTPVNEIFNTKQFQVTLEDYSPKAMGSTTTLYVTLPEIPAGGFVYTNIHLDYGLKGTLGYGKDGNNNATAFGTSDILIKDLQSYDFADNLGLSHSVQSINIFKKNPGIGGGAKNNQENPKSNAKVLIYQGTKLLGTVYTDIDGWYMWAYKYTGKPTTFTIKLPEYGLSKSITLKSNGYVQVDFVAP